MNHKNWIFTTYEDGKPVATQKLNHEQALDALRAAIDGKSGLAAFQSESQVSQVPQPVAELARAA